MGKTGISNLAAKAGRRRSFYFSPDGEGIIFINEAVMNSFVLDLRRFSAEEEGRTELPSEQKKKKARQEGQVMKSQDMVSFISLFSCFYSIVLFFDMIVTHVRNIFLYFLQTNLAFTAENLNTMLMFTGKELLPVLAVIFIPPVILGSAATVFQTGFLFVPKLIAPDFKKIAPNFSAYFKRIFGRQGAVQLGKSILLVAGCLIILWVSINSSMYEIFNTAGESYQKTITLFFSLFRTIMLRIGILLIAFVIIDYFFQRWQYIDSLKMSKQELLQEFYEEEGRPEIQRALERKRREIMKRRSVREVKNADVVITNPTHYAIALKYDRDTGNAPRVIAKGEDLMALRIREIAEENGVIIFENKPLARELYKRLEIGDFIPQDLLMVVAEIYGHIQREYNKRGRYVQYV